MGIEGGRKWESMGQVSKVYEAEVENGEGKRDGKGEAREGDLSSFKS